MGNNTMQYGHNEVLNAFGIDLEDQICIIRISVVREKRALKIKSLLPLHSGN
jgi:hypothetical protein